jgi:class 3 adenylate cyclase
MTLLVLYSMVVDDIKQWLLPQYLDDPVDYSLLACILFFVLEVTLMSIATEGYFMSFFFWLDIFSTASLIADLSWVSNEMLGPESMAANTSQLARAGRASRAGTRTSRILRVIRTVRLLRVMNRYKLTNDNLARRESQIYLYRSLVIFRGTPEPILKFRPDFHQELREIEVSDEVEMNESFTFAGEETPLAPLAPAQTHLGVSEATLISQPRLSTFRTLHASQHIDAEDAEAEGKNKYTESKVGKRLSELTTKRVVILVLGIMFVLPLMTLSLFYDETTSSAYGLEAIYQFRESPETFEICWNKYIKDHSSQDTPLIFLEMVGRRTWQSSPSPSSLRTSELMTYHHGSGHDSLSAVFDMRSSIHLQAKLNLARTAFVCLLLCVSSLIFAKDANDLVIGPIENMIKRVKKISINPLEAAQDEEREALERELVIMENPKLSKKLSTKVGLMETEVLEQTIIKIGALLALGFGEAGSEIIATNMKKGGGEVDSMLPGRKSYCIFGFCDIRNFTDATEILQEGVMIFVNEIAEIVHSIAYLYSGSPNKNIGDAFLLVWKFPQYMKPNSNRTTTYVQQTSDMSLISFLKIIVEINRNPKILKYRKNEALRRQMPNYSVKMGFGLHVGWAIEGAIGSEFKIDASYLSPHVNIASRLESATKAYGVPILVSGKLVDLFSPQMKKRVREIDRVHIKGSKDPISLYTCDVNTTVLPPGQSEFMTQELDMKLRKVKLRIKRDELRQKIQKSGNELWRLFEDDWDLHAMTEGFPPDFFQSFRGAYKHYIKGQWEEAKAGLMYAEEMKGMEDGPIQSLLHFIDLHQGVAPHNWAGHREVPEK